MAFGRPTEYKPDFSASIVELGRKGKSIVSRCANLGISKTTYHEWINPESTYFKPDFKEAHDEAELLCQDWWENAGQDHMVEHKDGTKLNANVYRLNMMNRFGWGEKREQHNLNEDITVTIGGDE